jgi:hypothetical protein
MVINFYNTGQAAKEHGLPCKAANIFSLVYDL